MQLKFNHTCTTVKDLHSTCLKWSVSKFFYFYVWLISLRLGEDWLVLISKLWVQQDISSVWNCVPVMQIAFRSISAEIGCSASWIHNTRRTLSKSRKISQRQGILFISQKHLSQTWVFNWIWGGGGGRGEGTDLPKLLKTSLNIYIHILKSSIFTSVSACMCERRRGKCYSYNFKTVKSYSCLDLSWS